MASAHSPATTPIRDWKWSPAEKTVARRAFELTLSRELESVLREAKERVARIREPSELWDLEHWLGERRRQIDRAFDFRYSVLPQVFANLLRNGQITEEDLRGLAPAKLDAIRRMARF
jgi:hypothetical protein